jgi:hypothetical protein
MATGKQLNAAILARRSAKGPRKKRTRPEPRQYTVADLERARDRVAAALRRIDNDRRSNPNRGRAGLERAQLGDPGEDVAGPHRRLWILAIHTSSLRRAMIPNYVKGLKEFEHWQSYTHNPSSPVRTALAKTLRKLGAPAGL